MSRRMYYIALCVISLAVGGSYYLLFENHTVFENIVCRYVDIMPFKEMLPRITSVFMQNHFCDLLWAFSLQSGLFAILLPTKKQKIFISVTVVLCGMVWEISQLVDITSGTGDVLDVVMYVLGSATVLLFTTKKGEKT